MSDAGKTNGVAAFEQTAAHYEGWFQTALGSYVDACEREAFVRLIADLGDVRPPAAVLEIGAGTGHVARWLAEQGFVVQAVEPAYAMRAIGQQTLKDLPVRWHDALAERLPFNDGSFDGAVFFTTLEFVAEPAAALREALRVLRPDGWLCIAFLNALSPFAATYRYQASRGKMPWAAARFFVREELEQMLGGPAQHKAVAVYLAPAATAPFEAADRAGQRAGNAPALELLLWRKSCTNPK